MAYSFPPNPTIGQIYTINGRSWKWDGVQWTVGAVFSSTSAPVYVSVSPPVNPVQGSLWYNTVTGVFSLYLTNLEGGAWFALIPYPSDSITADGGVFNGPIYATYTVPNNPAAFATVGSVTSAIRSYLTTNGYAVAGNGFNVDANGQVISIDGGLLV